MFVKRKDYEELRDEYFEKVRENSTLKELELISMDRIRGYKEKINGLELNCENLNGLVRVLEDRNKELHEEKQRLLGIIENLTNKEEEVTNEETKEAVC